MKKMVSIVMASMALFFLSFTISMAGIQAGISGTVGVYEASGSEEEGASGAKETTTANGAIKIAYPTIFVEYNAGPVIIGLDVIPGSITSEEASRTDYAPGDTGTTTDLGTNTVKVKISRHFTLYGLLPIMDTGAFLRAGISRMDVATQESLSSGSAYDDKDGVEGATVGLGYQHDTDKVFIRAEIGYSVYQQIKLTSTTNADNKVEVDLEGGFARISIGRAF